MSLPQKAYLREQMKVVSSITYHQVESLAYAAFRLPPLLAVTERLFREVRLLLPDYHPTSMLDFGSGPGTAIISALSAWEHPIQDILAIEPSSSMTSVAQALLNEETGIRWRRFLNPNSEESFSLTSRLVAFAMRAQHVGGMGCGSKQCISWSQCVCTD